MTRAIAPMTGLEKPSVARPAEAEIPDAPATGDTETKGVGDDLPDALTRWVGAGLIRAEQAAAIDRFEAGRGEVATAGSPPSRVGMPVVVEILGYLGIVIVAAAGGLAISGVWPDLATAARLVLVGVVTGLVAGGATWISSSRDAAVERLANFLWLIVTAGVAAWVSILAGDAIGASESQTGLSTSLALTAESALLLAWRRSTLAHLALFLGVVAVAMSLCSFFDTLPEWLPGAVLWSIGAAWSVVAWRALLPHPRAGTVLGAVATLYGAVFLAGTTEAPGLWLGLATGATLLTAGVRSRSGVLLGFGIVGMLGFVGGTIAYYVGATAGEGHGNLAVTLVILVLGLLVLVGALVAARRRVEPPGSTVPTGSETPARARSRGPREARRPRSPPPDAAHP